MLVLRNLTITLILLKKQSLLKDSGMPNGIPLSLTGGT